MVRITAILPTLKTAAVIESPQYPHDCKTCQFLGRYQAHNKNYDLYYCAGGITPSVVARFDDHYEHGSYSDIHIGINSDPGLIEAYRRTLERGFPIGTMSYKEYHRHRDAYWRKVDEERAQRLRTLLEQEQDAIVTEIENANNALHILRQEWVRSGIFEEASTEAIEKALDVFIREKHTELAKVMEDLKHG